jgi:hypothetical protein
MAIASSRSLKTVLVPLMLVAVLLAQGLRLCLHAPHVADEGHAHATAIHLESNLTSPADSDAAKESCRCPSFVWVRSTPTVRRRSSGDGPVLFGKRPRHIEPLRTFAHWPPLRAAHPSAVDPMVVHIGKPSVPRPSVVPKEQSMFRSCCRAMTVGVATPFASPVSAG